MAHVKGDDLCLRQTAGSGQITCKTNDQMTASSIVVQPFTPNNNNYNNGNGCFVASSTAKPSNIAVDFKAQVSVYSNQLLLQNTRRGRFTTTLCGRVLQSHVTV